MWCNGGGLIDEGETEVDVGSPESSVNGCEYKCDYSSCNKKTPSKGKLIGFY